MTSESPLPWLLDPGEWNRASIYEYLCGLLPVNASSPQRLVTISHLAYHYAEFCDARRVVELMELGDRMESRAADRASSSLYKAEVLLNRGGLFNELFSGLPVSVLPGGQVGAPSLFE